MSKTRMKNLSIAVLTLVLALSLCFGISSFSKANQAVAAGQTYTFDFKTNGSDFPGVTAEKVSGQIVVNQTNYELASSEDANVKMNFVIGISTVNAGGSSRKAEYDSSRGISFARCGVLAFTLESGANVTVKTRSRDAVIGADPYAGTIYTSETYQNFGNNTTTNLPKDTETKVALPAGNYKICSPSATGGSWRIEKITIEYTTCDVTFMNGSETVSSSTINSGASVTAPAEQVKQGFVFAEWNTEADGSGTAYEAGATIENISSNLTLYAIFDEIVTEISANAKISKVFAQDLTWADILPETVMGVTATGSVELEVEWDVASIELTNTFAGTINGTATIKDGYVFATDIGATSVEVVIKATAPQVLSVEPLEQVSIILYSSADDLAELLPKTVTATVEDEAELMQVPVEWDTTSVNLSAAGDYSATGSIKGNDYTLATGVTITQPVNVYTVDVSAIASVSKTFLKGNVDAELPTTVVVTLDTAGNPAVELNVTWESFSVDQTGEITVYGDLELSGTPYTNSQSIRAIAIVNIVELTIATFDPYLGGTSANNNYGVSWMDTYADKVVAKAPGISVKALDVAQADNHNQTLPIIKLPDGDSNNGVNAVEIEIHEKATDVKITVYAVTYSGSEGLLKITDGTNSLIEDETASITGNSNTATANEQKAFQAITPTVVTVTAQTGGTYYINRASGKSIYIIGIEVEAVVPEMATLTYQANLEGATAPAAVSVEKNSSIIIEAATPATGYKFINWNTEADGSGTAYEVGDQYQATENGVLYAQYIKEILSFEKVSTNEKIFKIASFEGLASASEKLEVINLISTIKGYDVEGQDYDLVITWNTELLTEADFAMGSYQLTGTIQESENPFASDLVNTISQKVIIIEDTLVIESFATLENISVEVGSTSFDYPTTIVATIKDNIIDPVTLDIDWTNDDPSTMILSEKGQKTFVGSAVIDSELYSLDEGLENEISLTVIAYNYQVESVVAVSDVTTFVGIEADLPEFVTVVYDANQNLTTQLEVVWDKTNVDLSTVGSYVATGVVQGTALYEIDATLANISANVIVKEYSAASIARSTDFSDYTISGSGTLRGFTISGATPGSVGGVNGIKIKEGSLSFTLTAPAKVTIYYGYTASITVTFAGETLPSGNNVKTFDLVANTYTFSATGNSGSVAIGYIIIDDGASEIAVCEQGDILKDLPDKTVDGIEYQFAGAYSNAEGTIVIPAGQAAVVEETYYALYYNVSLFPGASISVTENKSMMMKADVNMLNAAIVLENLIQTGFITVETSFVSDSVEVENGTTLTKNADSFNYIFSTGAITDTTKVYTAYLEVTTIATGEVYSYGHACSAKDVAEYYLADVKATSDAQYKFAVEGGYSFFTADERELISAYLQ